MIFSFLFIYIFVVNIVYYVVHIVCEVDVIANSLVLYLPFCSTLNKNFFSSLSSLQKHLNFQLGNITIKPDDKARLLGIELDSKLNVNCHIHEICQNAARQINALKRLAKFLTLESRMAIFRSFIMSNFNYCSLVWHACGVKNTRTLEKLQERALRFVYLDKVSS